MKNRELTIKEQTEKKKRDYVKALFANNKVFYKGEEINARTSKKMLPHVLIDFN